VAEVTLVFNAENRMGGVIAQATGQIDALGQKITATSTATAGLKGVEQVFRGIASAAQAPVAGLQQTAAAAQSAAKSVTVFGTEGPAALGRVQAAARLTEGDLSKMLKSGEIQAQVAKLNQLGDAAAKVGTQAAGAGAGFHTLAVAAQAPAAALASTAQAAAGTAQGIAKIGTAAASAAQGVAQVGAAANGAAGGLEGLARGALTLGPALGKIAAENTKFIQGMGKFGEIRPAFQAVQGMVDSLAASFVKTGTVSTAEIAKIKVQLQELARARLTSGPTSGAEAAIIANANRQVQESIRIARAHSVAQAETEAAIRKTTGAISASVAPIKASGAAMAGFKNVLTSLVPAFTAIGASLLILNQLKASLREFAESERGIRQMAAALETVGAPIPETVNRVEALIETLKRASVFDDEALRAAFTNLVTLSGDAAASMRVLPGVMELATARGIDLASAADMVGKALEGNVVILQRTGVRFSDAEKKVLEFGGAMERAAVIAAKLAEQFGGRFAADVDTTAGKIEKAKVAWHDFQEVIGKTLLQTFGLLAKFTELLDIPLRKLREFLLLGSEAGKVTPPGGGGGWGGTGKVTDSGQVGPTAAQAAAIVAMQQQIAEGAKRSAKETEEAYKRRQAAIEAAIADSRRYADELATLTVTEKSTAREQRLLTDAVGKFGDTAAALNVDQIRQRIIALGDSMVQAGRKISAGFKAIYDQAKTQAAAYIPINVKMAQTWEEVFEEQEFERVKAKILAGGFGIPIKMILPPATKVRTDVQKILDDATKNIRLNFADSLTEAIADFGATGGKNLESIVAGALSNAAKIGAEGIFKMLENAVIKAQNLQMQPGETPEAFQARQTGAAQQKIGKYAGYVAGAYSMYQGFTANQQGQVGDTETIIQSTLSGLVSGGIYGAIAGLVVGIVSAVISDVGAEYKYGYPSIRGGRAEFLPQQNIKQREAEDIERRMQAVFDKFYNGFSLILLKVQNFIPDFVRNMDISFTRGLDQGGYIGRAASANFAKHLDRLINEGIPSEVGRAFRPAFEAAFQQMGYSIERFGELWKMLEGMDPQAGLQLLETLVDIGLGLQRFREMPGWNTTVTGGLSIQPGILQQEYERSRRTPAAALQEDLGNKIMEYAQSLGQLTGEAQIARAKELVGLMDQWQEAARNVAREQLAAAEAVTKSFGATIRELEIEGLKKPGGEADVQAQVEYLKKYADELIAQLPQATSFAEVTQLSDEIRGIFLRIKGLGASLGEGADEAYRQWALENLKNVQQIALDRIKELGQQMSDQTEHLRSAIEEFIAVFLTATQEIAGADGQRHYTPGTGGQPPGVPETPPVDGAGGGGGGGGGGGRGRYASETGAVEDVYKQALTVVATTGERQIEVAEVAAATASEAVTLAGAAAEQRAATNAALDVLAEVMRANDPKGVEDAVRAVEATIREADIVGPIVGAIEGVRGRQEETNRLLERIADAAMEPPQEQAPAPLPGFREEAPAPDKGEERQRGDIVVLEEIRDEIRARREAEEATAQRIVAALEDGVKVDGGELRIIVEQADTGQRVADFTTRLQQARVGRGRR
jgi:hypothetical protein